MWASENYPVYALFNGDYLYRSRVAMAFLQAGVILDYLLLWCGHWPRFCRADNVESGNGCFTVDVDW